MTVKRKKGKKINWKQIKNDYLYNDFTLQGLSDKYNVSMRQIAQHSSDEKWTELREEESKKIAQETQKKIREREIARRVAANEEHLRLYNDGLEVVKNLLQVYQNQSAEFKRRGNVNPFNLEKIFCCIEKAQKGQRLALNMEKEDNTTDTEPKVFIVEGIDESKI